VERRVEAEHLLHVAGRIGDDGVRAVPAAAVSGELLDWPLDPLTPITRVDALPEGEPVTGADVALWNRAGAVLTAALTAGTQNRTADVSYRGMP
jgi:hypothetical protein